MMWPEEEARERDHFASDYRARAALFVDEYFAADWRQRAVRCVRVILKEQLAIARASGEIVRLPELELLSARLEEAGLSALSKRLRSHDDEGVRHIAGALLADAAGTLFCSAPSVPRWQLAGAIIDDDLVAFTVMVRLVKRRLDESSALRNRIRSVARRIVEQAVANPAAQAHRNEGQMIAEMLRGWAQNPRLQEIWFGVRGVGYLLPFRSDWHIFDLLFETDVAFAAELIEEYRAPFQPKMILEFGYMRPGSHYEHWERLMQHALPAFQEDGTWNGNVLLPLLLYAAQDALRSAQYRLSDLDVVNAENDEQFAELTRMMGERLFQRSDGSAAALRWGAWLFRDTMARLDQERAAYPSDPKSRARSTWLMVEALFKDARSVSWLGLRPTDIPAEDELCLEAMRILAANEHDHPVPGREAIFGVLPSEPEQFLDGAHGRRMREMPSLFVVWGKRPDALGLRVLALALLDADVATTFSELWRQTLTLRELVEHGHAYRVEGEDYDDHTRRAGEIIRFVLSIGINLIDYVEHPSQELRISDRHATTLALMNMLHDAAREMLAIDPTGHSDMEAVHNHLCARRVLYEVTSPENGAVAALLRESDAPTLGAMLFNRCSVSRSFFECLQMLLANGTTRDRIARSLQVVRVDLQRLVAEVGRLNAIEHTRRIEIAGLESPMPENSGTIESKG